MAGNNPESRSWISSLKNSATSVCSKALSYCSSKKVKDATDLVRNNPGTSVGIFAAAAAGASFGWLYHMYKHPEHITGETANTNSSWYETYKLAKSASTFHVSILYNKLRFGKAFSFDQVMGRPCAEQKDQKPYVNIENNKLISIHDGKKSPLYLGSIPRYKQHIDEIRKHANLGSKDSIGLYTLNRDFERNWAGLTALEKTESIISHKYPTTDYSAPSFVDLLRAVRDLKNPNETIKARYVHCKAGRGRSAAIINAYLMNVAHELKSEVTSQQVEEYLKMCRNRVSINDEQHTLLARFSQELKAAGNFDLLSAQYKSEIETRDRELS
jgi:protein-tyrosine phosphatase